MTGDRELIVDMAQKCLHTMRHSDKEVGQLPQPLHPKHLVWMCEQVVENAEHSSLTKLHRWLGFIQAGLLANRMLTLEHLKHMFDEVKSRHNYDAHDEDRISDGSDTPQRSTAPAAIRETRQVPAGINGALNLHLGANNPPRCGFLRLCPKILSFW